VQSAFARPQAGTIQELLEAPASQYVENIFVDGVVALSTAAPSSPVRFDEHCLRGGTFRSGLIFHGFRAGLVTEGTATGDTAC